MDTLTDSYSMCDKHPSSLTTWWSDNTTHGKTDHGRRCWRLTLWSWETGGRYRLSSSAMSCTPTDLLATAAWGRKPVDMTKEIERVLRGFPQQQQMGHDENSCGKSNESTNQFTLMELNPWRRGNSLSWWRLRRSTETKPRVLLGRAKHRGVT
jgi:hypothetical protein